MKPPTTLNLRDKISPEDLAKIEAQKTSDSTFPVTEEWLLIAEWVRLTGLDGYLAYRDETITFHEMIKIIEANRALEAYDMFRDAETSFVGAASAQSKKPSSTFKSMTKSILKRIKVE